MTRVEEEKDQSRRADKAIKHGAALCRLLAHSVRRMPSDDRLTLAADIPRATQLTQCMVRPRVARGMRVRLVVLRSCINVSGLERGAFFTRSGPPWICARIRSH
jgi:hypothetical protein